MDEFLFNKLREKGKENGIDIFKIDDYYGKKFVIHYFIERKLNKDEPIECGNEKVSFQLRQKTIEVGAMTKLDDVITKIKFQNIKKSPLGITPHFIWIEQRVDEIIKAMDRYREVGQKIPKEWYFELAQLETERIKNTNHLEVKVTQEEASKICQEIARENFKSFFR